MSLAVHKVETSSYRRRSRLGVQPQSPASLTSPDFSAGVDKLALRWLIDPDRCILEALDEHAKAQGKDYPVILPNRQHPLQVRTKVQGVGAVMPALRARNPAGFSPVHVRIEFNPSRTYAPGLCPVEQVLGVATLVAASLADVFIPVKSLETATIERVDLTRDFIVASPERWLEAMRPLRAQHSRKRPGYFGKDGSLETVVSGKEGCRVQFYDKAKRNPGDWAAKHNLRWESQVRRDAARGLGLRTLQDLTAERLTAAMRQQWIYSRGDEARLPPHYSEVVASSTLEPQSKQRLIAYAMSKQRNLDLGFAESERKVLRAQATSLSIHMRGTAVRASTGVLRLDLRSGREVLCPPV